jgi:acyl carrier protein
MTSDALAQQVHELIGTILGLDASFGDRFSTEVTPEWDSLRHIEIMLAIEDEYSVRVAEEDFATLGSEAAICDFLIQVDAAR